MHFSPPNTLVKKRRGEEWRKCEVGRDDTRSARFRFDEEEEKESLGSREMRVERKPFGE